MKTASGFAMSFLLFSLWLVFVKVDHADHRVSPSPADQEVRQVSVQVVSHPLASSMLADLRDRNTPPPLFRLLAKRLALVLCLEATKGMLTTPVEVETPLARAAGARLAQPLVAVPVLRAGLGMLDAVTELFPEVTVGYVGLERDHATFEPSLYYSKLPPLKGRLVLLLDPILATGASAAAACGELEKA